MEEGGSWAGGRVARVDPVRLEDALRRLPPGPLRPSDLRVAALQLFADWDIDCHYAPFDHVERRASLVLVGINPGLAQAANALGAARDALWAGASWEEAQRASGGTGAFEGPLLTNLVRMLDELGLPRLLAGAGVCFVRTTRELFASGRHELHVTHCVRYPVAVSGRDYTGRRPVLLRDPRLNAFVFGVLGPELAQVPGALVAPLGRVAAEAVEALVAAGRLEAGRCLLGLPHPSGANGHREADFERARPGLTRTLRAWFEGRTAAMPVQPASLESP